MRQILKATAVAVTPLLLTVPAWAADEIQKTNGQKILEGLLPLLLIFGLLYFFLRRVNKRNGPYMDRAMVHMERLEKQNEEIIGLLKDISGKRRSPEPPPPPYAVPASGLEKTDSPRR